jgi:hypothetical protein
MRWVLNKHLVSTVLVLFTLYVLPARVLAGDAIAIGKKSADEAATWRSDQTPDTDTFTPLRYAIPLTGAYAQPDTTEFEFPEEESKHLARDITIFVIVSVFVAYFIIKVFLEGDKEDEQQEDGNGKVPPPI